MSEPMYTPWKADDPLVTVTITEPDTMTVRMFGVPYPTPPELAPLTRGSFGMLMDHLYQRLGQPFTVELIETDGVRRTGTIDLRAPQPESHSTPKQPESLEVPRRAESGREVRRLAAPTVAEPTLGEEAAWVRPVSETDPEPGLAGFFPGEPVTLCLCVGVGQANRDGMVPAAVPSWLSGEVLVVGRSSGRVRTITTGRE